MLPDRHPHPRLTAPRRRRRRRPAGGAAPTLLVAALIAAPLVACSSDDEASDEASTSTSVVATPTTGAAAPDTAAPVPTADTVPDTSVPDTTDVTDATTTVEPAPDDTAAIEATRALFADITDDDPGCTVAAGRDGDVVYAEAFGAARLDPFEPMTTDTIVDIGSTSKQFTATAILLLADEGRLSLDDVVADHVPGLPEWGTQITLRQLMHHTSGIPDYIELLVGDGFELTGSSTDADALAALAAAPELDFEPGTSWTYSNSNYFLMGQVVLAVAGVPLDDYLDAEVFQPLDLAMVMDPAAALPGKAVSYDGTGDGRTVADSRWEQLGDGGIQTTPSELVRWSSQYWRPTIGGAGITAARLDDAADMVDPTDPSGTVTGRYGAGIQVFGDDELGTVLSHAGGWGGFVTAFLMVPDQRLTVAATCTSIDTLIRIGLTNEDVLLEPWTTPTS